MFQKIKLLPILIGILILTIASCSSLTNLSNTVTPTPMALTVTAPPVPTAPLSEFIDDLQNAGATVEQAGTIEQPFFKVRGQVLKVNGEEVDVFVFASQAARQEVSNTISQGSTALATLTPANALLPQLWAEENLIVLYPGQNDATIQLLTSLLGEPLMTAVSGTPLPPKAALQAQQKLSQTLNVPVGQVEILSSKQMDWPNACLDLGKADEACAQVITPGWQFMMRAGGQVYEVHSDQTGDVVRWKQVEGPAVTPIPNQQAAQAAKQQLSQALNIPADQVIILSSSQMDWSDSCLGLGQSNESCALVVTPGWRFMIQANNQVYEVHTDLSGSQVRWRQAEGGGTATP